ncbi:SusC/RagA family TonB-linked outer membrane protein [Echinicola marina]|uniref:SusC/RagA family TonB-linked outer membrane protein n=1 Tax=Echinicola marina TaxID=2859768 RepID=UPI001CF6763C|nr:SusC/RagA family TonB-linked outer membrane protein [Echinicola marina]UCS94907.1 SusC/RagA family TonB-linked outer membrane protein [Echinicola marina]
MDQTLRNRGSNKVLPNFCPIRILPKIVLLLISLFLINANASFAQSIVKGLVKDDKGDALPGVSVLIKGTSRGTVTNIDGLYELSISSSDIDGKLIFSFLGYETQELSIDGRSEINVTLSQTLETLGEVVVVGYGTLDKKELTSAVTHVSSEELLTVAANNPLMSLQGKVAGLSISNSASADPNSGPSIQLRGVSSRDAGLGPLIVINGFPGGSLENINQNDIESIDVLKGGAASAIYGTRGSNGVIIITTKSGKGESSAEYNGYTSFDFLNKPLRSLSAEEFVAHERGNDYGYQTNWLNEVTRDYALTQQHTLSLSGGDSRNSFRATIDYRDGEGIDTRSKRNEYGARLMYQHTAKSNLYKVNINVAPRFTKRRNADYDVFNQALTLNPTIPVRDPDSPSSYFNIQSGYSAPYNIRERLDLELSGSEEKVIDWNGSFTLNILPTLDTKITLGQSTADYFDFFFRPSYSTYAINNEGGDNSASRNYNKNDTRSFEWIGNYYFSNDKHDLKALAGYSYQYFENSGINISNRDFPSDAFTYNNIGTGLYNQEEGRLGMGSYKNSSKLIAFFGRVNYSFKGKYMASASLRHEGSSKFGYDNKWGSFPALSVGWRISDEAFAQGISWLEDLKIRADYGVTGNQNFGNYLSLDTYTGYGYYPINGEFYQVWGPNQNTNYNLRWETAKNFNVGLDFGLWDNKISGSINYYNRKNEDLLGYYNVQLPPNLVGSTYANVGTMENSGLEIQLNATIVDQGDFRYQMSFVGATNQNKFVSFSNDQFEGQSFLDVVGMPAPGSPGTAQRLEEGRRVGSFYMLESAGVSDNGELLVYNNEGDVITADRASDEDKRYVGNGLPRFTGSIGNNFTYKNWDASIFLRGNFGYEIFNTLAFYIGTPATQSEANVLETAYDGEKYSRLTSSSTSAVLSDYFLEKGDFVKLDNISLGYTFDVQSKYVRSIRFYGAARNLATFTSFKGGDPDAYPVNGLYPGINASRAYYPSTSQVIFGANFRF